MKKDPITAPFGCDPPSRTHPSTIRRSSFKKKEVELKRDTVSSPVVDDGALPLLDDLYIVGRVRDRCRCCVNDLILFGIAASIAKASCERSST